MRSAWMPGCLLLILAGGEYGGPVLSDLTGWPVEWCDYILSGAATAALWALAGAHLPRTLLMPPGAAVCVWGAFEALQRPACAVAQMLDPVPLDGLTTLCQAHTGVDLYALGVAGLSVLAALLAGWSDGRSSRSG